MGGRRKRAGLMKKGTGHCVKSEVQEGWLVVIEFLSDTCYSEEGGSGGNCCAEISVVTQSCLVSDCHPADFSVTNLHKRPS